jgi:hypothetical protein
MAAYILRDISIFKELLDIISSNPEPKSFSINLLDIKKRSRGVRQFSLDKENLAIFACPNLFLLLSIPYHIYLQ